MAPQADPQAVRRCIERVLDDAGLRCDAVGDGRVMTVLAGEHKRTIGVLLAVGDRTLSVQSQLVAQLDQGHREVYELLLHRNERSRHIFFALDDAGQLLLVGRVPLQAVDTELVGELLGEVLAMADAVFNTVLRTGFADYLGHEQAWRSRVGLPPNPVGDPQD